MTGKVPTDREIDDAVSTWHEANLMSLQEYLGWSLGEYAAWVLDPRAIPQRPLREIGA